MKSFFLRFLLLVLMLGAGAALIGFDAREQLSAPLSIASPLRFEIAPGSRLRAGVAALRDRGMFANLRQPLYFELWARVSGEAQMIKAGEYALEPGLSSLDILALWVSGRIVLHEVTLVEGLRFDQALKLVTGHPELRKTLTDLNPEAVMAALGAPGVHPEGRIFPDTYRFPRGTTDVAVLRQGLEAMNRTLAEAWAARAPDLPYARPEEALVMASIVEKETGRGEERARIAGVFVRRLVQGMRLQTDPTVIYGLGAGFDGNLRKRDLLADGPYNTYARTGLPPTPICLPGRAAIEAALHPEPGTELFFVARGDGSHEFSTTLSEHEAAVRKFQLGQGGG
ncbi:MAG: endolytic transglycosylase MltG [Panacagrimonas sp.]